MSLSLDSMKVMTRRFAEEPWGNGNLSVLDEVCASNYVIGEDGNLQNLKDAILAFRRAMPDLKCSISEMIAEGDMVAYRWTMHGTHQGEYQGIVPTGKPVTFDGITIVRFANGKIIDDQFQSSSPSLEQQAV
jgi:predicted ester cyclase